MRNCTTFQLNQSLGSHSTNMEQNRAVSRSTKFILRQFKENVWLSIHKDYSLYQINIGCFFSPPQVQAKFSVNNHSYWLLSSNIKFRLAGSWLSDYQYGIPFSHPDFHWHTELSETWALQALKWGKQRSLPCRTITYDQAGKWSSSLRAHCLVLVQI